jgi:hypothetical protein
VQQPGSLLKCPIMSQIDSGAFEQSSATLGRSHHRALDMTDNTRQACNHLRHARHALALPLYAIALIISCLSDVIGNIAAKIADDDWPR